MATHLHQLLQGQHVQWIEGVEARYKVAQEQPRPSADTAIGLDEA